MNNTNTANTSPKKKACVKQQITPSFERHTKDIKEQRDRDRARTQDRRDNRKLKFEG